MSIRTKLITIFLAIIISTMIVAALFFLNTKESLKKLRVEEVTNIAALKHDKIDTFITEREIDIKSFQHFFMVKKYLPVISKHFNAKTSPCLHRRQKAVGCTTETLP